MIGKRTGIDFSKHVHRTEILINELGTTIRIDHFQVGDSNMNYICFTNTSNKLIVTGDFNDWIFSRPFVPDAGNYVSDPYWLEKLRLNSTQLLGNYDSDETSEEIKLLIEVGLEEYGYEGDKLEQAKEWYESLLDYVEDEVEYTYHAYRDYNKPKFIDYEDIPFCKKIDNYLLIIFDAFDEICNRLKK